MKYLAIVRRYVINEFQILESLQKYTLWMRFVEELIYLSLKPVLDFVDIKLQRMTMYIEGYLKDLMKK